MAWPEVAVRISLAKPILSATGISALTKKFFSCSSMPTASKTFPWRLLITPYTRPGNNNKKEDKFYDERTSGNAFIDLWPELVITFPAIIASESFQHRRLFKTFRDFICRRRSLAKSSNTNFLKSPRKRVKMKHRKHFSIYMVAVFTTESKISVWNIYLQWVNKQTVKYAFIQNFL